MANISHYEKLIQEKRKKTSFRDFVKELGSWETVSFYKNKGEISKYPENKRTNQFSKDFWEIAPDFGVDIDTGIPFLKQFEKLHLTIPLQRFMQFGMNENSEYADFVFGCKNVYLSSVIGYNAENIVYSMFCYNNVTNVYNSFFASNNVENVYMSAGVTASYNVFFSKYISDSSDIWFSSNLIGCKDCIGCDNLQNQSYYIANKQYSEVEYLKKKADILKDKKGFEKYFKLITTRKGVNYGSSNVEGNFIIRCTDIRGGGWIVNMQDSSNNIIGHGGKISTRFTDTIDTGMNSDNLCCVIGGGGDSHDLYCSSQIDQCSNVYYCYFMQNCHHCLGCIGLKNKSYCILNKQYTKEEWEIVAEKIFASMETNGTLGDFFPASMNPFYFNDTLAYLIDDSFTREEIVSEGYLWRDEAIRVDIPEGLEIVQSTALDTFQGYDASGKWIINPSILDKAIVDTSGNYYRIVKMEYDFLMKHGLPLPTLHWLDRIKIGFR